ncbi:MAG: flavodoxin family protein [Bacilli bacterium]|jgi:multimeric flavodoxin WrbA|nr:flavodoxin family protein [Bacilli bacterium]
MKKFFVLSGSPRPKGNSNQLADQFIKGAKDAGHEVISINAYQINLKPCLGCNACWSKGKPCILDDDNELLKEAMFDTDVIVLVSPLYWFGFSGQMKLVIDKLYPFIPKISPQPSQIKESYLISCCFNAHESEYDSLRNVYHQMNEYMGWTSKKELLVNNMVSFGDINKTKYLEEAYQLGYNL